MSDWTPVPVPKLSPSAINTFITCPQQFKFGKIDKIYGPGSEATVRGSYVHEVLEYLFKEPAEKRTIEKAREIAGNRWKHGRDKYKRTSWETRARDAGVTDMNKFKWASWHNIKTYFDMEDPTTIEPIGLETWVSGPILDVEIRGIIDRLDEDGEKVVIVDYKTGKSAEPGGKYDAAKILPLMIYAELTEEEQKREVDRMELLYVSDGTRAVYHPTAENREAMYKTVRETYDAIAEACKTGEFEARKSALCDWCDHKSYCPAWSKK